MTVLGVLLALFSLFTLLAMLSPEQGMATGWLLDRMWTLFGWGGPVGIIASGLLGVWMISWGLKMPLRFSQPRIMGGAVLFLIAEGLFSLASLVMSNGLTTLDMVRQEQSGGGLIGYFLSFVFASLIGVPTTIVLFSLLGVLACVLMLGLRWQDFKDFIQRPDLNPQARQEPLKLRLRGRNNPDDEEAAASRKRRGSSFLRGGTVKRSDKDEAAEAEVDEEEDEEYEPPKKKRGK